MIKKTNIIKDFIPKSGSRIVSKSEMYANLL